MQLKLTLPHEYSPRSYQKEVFAAYAAGAKRFVLVWHRRSGKDKTMLNFMICRMLERRGMYWYVLPTYEQARLIIWEGMGSGGATEGMPFLDHFPQELIQYKNEQRLEIGLVNGSIFRLIGSDHVDRIVGANPVGAVFSEYSLQQPAAWEFVAPILVENKGWAAFIFTPRGRNHAFKLWESAQGARGWYSTVHTVDDTIRDAAGEDGTAVVTEEMLQSERDRGVEEDLIQQEYYCSFVGFREGSYYGRQMADLYKAERIRDVSWDPKFPVFTGWDLGIADQTAIWFGQRIGREIYLIDYYYNVNKGLDHYIKIIKDKPYIYGKHFAPHDIEHREFTSGKSRKEFARDLGIYFTAVPRLPVQEGIDNARAILPRCYFDKSRCDMGIRALINYHKDFNNKLLTFKTHPVHDVWSHGADAFRIFSQRIDDMDVFKSVPTEYIRDFDIFEERHNLAPQTVQYENNFDIFGKEERGN